MGKNKTSVKICGITSIEQALQVCELGADAIGIISVKESQRYVDLEEKQKIFKVLKDLYPRVERVSVLKNHPLELLIDNLKKKANETIIQLHGDENIDYCQKLKQKIPNICLWKAFRIKDKKDLEKIRYYESFLDAILLDSWNKDTYGGSGKKIEQKYLEDLSFTKPWWLAGGISKDWIEFVLKKINPDGVDISSSIEISPGIKDIKKTEELINEIRRY